MATPFVHRRQVEFRDTDAAGIAHFSVFYVWMEQAEHALLRHLGTSVMSRDRHKTLSWPRVSAQCDFQSPVSFEEELTIEVTITRLGEKSVTYAFVFLGGDQRQVARGKVTTVCCQLDQDGQWRAIPIPTHISDLFKPFTD